MEQSVEAMSAIPARMNEGWNRGDATAFFADFTDDAVFADFEGTIHTGREQMVAFHQPLFDTVLKGALLVRGEVRFARILRPGTGVVHHRVGLVMPGEQEPTSRVMMQLLAVVWQDDRWRVAALQNARLVSFDASAALDSLAAG
ncbi:SgcJ/EcaC family oxidoreductase [Allonocardiopsis opalescens]|uniref:Uncharacterized protein (TIGR02246 family) n=1 Tax=Allonocardiopsis opalescens TaxID=1144618 RepID=A0A2T0PYI2_9ACTN|nr:SgcJ/EcaC family oxidoreductase [Allonocardiopsis opalescens]PRX96605.1 uncharacterized protein (TIGR02246 family) [Allonocardiopsis opalescens]